MLSYPSVVTIGDDGCKACGCGIGYLFTVEPHVGLYCFDCQTWQRWVRKIELKGITYMATIAPAKTDTTKLQPGEYEATVTEVKDEGMSDAKFGAPKRRWLFKLQIDACTDCYSDESEDICDGKVGQEHFQWCNESAHPKSTMFKIVKACGLDPDEFDTDECVGKRLKFTYTEDVVDGKTVNVIATARPLRGNKKPRVMQPEEYEDNEVPF